MFMAEFSRISMLRHRRAQCAMNSDSAMCAAAPRRRMPCMVYMLFFELNLIFPIDGAHTPCSVVNIQRLPNQIGLHTQKRKGRPPKIKCFNAENAFLRLDDISWIIVSVKNYIMVRTGIFQIKQKRFVHLRITKAHAGACHGISSLLAMMQRSYVYIYLFIYFNRFDERAFDSVYGTLAMTDDDPPANGFHSIKARMEINKQILITIIITAITIVWVTKTWLTRVFNVFSSSSFSSSLGIFYHFVHAKINGKNSKWLSNEKKWEKNKELKIKEEDHEQEMQRKKERERENRRWKTNWNENIARRRNRFSFISSAVLLPVDGRMRNAMYSHIYISTIWICPFEYALCLIFLPIFNFASPTAFCACNARN